MHKLVAYLTALPCTNEFALKVFFPIFEQCSLFILSYLLQGSSFLLGETVLEIFVTVAVFSL